jgi:hypothetical protein
MQPYRVLYLVAMKGDQRQYYKKNLLFYLKLLKEVLTHVEIAMEIYFFIFTCYLDIMRLI